MLDAIKHGLGGLLNFEGRDARQAFWYYVLIVYILATAISMVVVLPISLQSMMAGVRQGIEASRGQDPAVAQAAVQASMMASMGKMVPAMMWVGVASGVIMLAGLGAAIVRRLHDSDLSGKWALIPAACQLISIVTVPSTDDANCKTACRRQATISNRRWQADTMMQNGSCRVWRAACSPGCRNRDCQSLLVRAQIDAGPQPLWRRAVRRLNGAPCHHCQEHCPGRQLQNPRFHRQLLHA